MTPPSEVDNDSEHQNPPRRSLPLPTLDAATLNLAATAGQCARIWQEIDPEFAAQCLAAAETAWQAALAHPAEFAGNTPGSGGGNYDDTQVSDEFYWAAAKLFITTGKEAYLDTMLDSPHFAQAAIPSIGVTPLLWARFHWR